MAQLVGGLHPDLIGREEVQVPGDAAGVRLRVSVVLALLLLTVPPGGETESMSWTLDGADTLE